MDSCSKRSTLKTTCQKIYSQPKRNISVSLLIHIFIFTSFLVSLDKRTSNCLACPPFLQNSPILHIYWVSLCSIHKLRSKKQKSKLYVCTFCAGWRPTKIFYYTPGTECNKHGKNEGKNQNENIAGKIRLEIKKKGNKLGSKLEYEKMKQDSNQT